jgi:hypothetical protein
MDLIRKVFIQIDNLFNNFIVRDILFTIIIVLIVYVSQFEIG